MLLLGPLIRDNGKFLLLDIKLKSSSVLTWEEDRRVAEMPGVWKNLSR